MGLTVWSNLITGKDLGEKRWVAIDISHVGLKDEDISRIEEHMWLDELS